MTGVTIFSATRVMAGELQPMEEQNFPVSLSTERCSFATLCSSQFKVKQPLQKRLFFFFFFSSQSSRWKTDEHYLQKAEDFGSLVLVSKAGLGNRKSNPSSS